MNDETDPELVALARIVEALEPLDLAARQRVLNYLVDRFTFDEVVGVTPPAS